MIQQIIRVSLISNCASSELIRFENNIQSMSNAELINCNYGINDRIKDIENRIGRDEHVNFPQNQQFISHRIYFVGGEIYDILLEDGVSLNKNYRAQFTSILKNNTPAQLIEQLEKKLAQQYLST